jgi:hypothetical protein
MYYPSVYIIIIIIIFMNKLSQPATHLTFILDVPLLYVGHNIT